MTIRTRAVLLAVLFVSFWAALGARAGTGSPPGRLPLLGMPMTIDGWEGRPTPPLEARILAVLGADDHLTRVYSNSAGQRAGLYVGFHASQRQGASIHSPMNCLPGAGWQPVSHRRIPIADRRDAAPAAATVIVNQVVIQKGEDRQLVLYWYQSQGRVVASEYAAKAHLFLDAARTGRSDASLVRIVTPIGDPSGELTAQNAAVSFATSLLPRLAPYLPE